VSIVVAGYNMQKHGVDSHYAAICCDNFYSMLNSVYKFNMSGQQQVTNHQLLLSDCLGRRLGPRLLGRGNDGSMVLLCPLIISFLPF
jgi:hypothetical protein